MELNIIKTEGYVKGETCKQEPVFTTDNDTLIKCTPNGQKTIIIPEGIKTIDREWSVLQEPMWKKLFCQRELKLLMLTLLIFAPSSEKLISQRHLKLLDTEPSEDAFFWRQLYCLRR